MRSAADSIGGDVRRKSYRPQQSAAQIGWAFHGPICSRLFFIFFISLLFFRRTAPWSGSSVKARCELTSPTFRDTKRSIAIGPGGSRVITTLIVGSLAVDVLVRCRRTPRKTQTYPGLFKVLKHSASVFISWSRWNAPPVHYPANGIELLIPFWRLVHCTVQQKIWKRVASYAL